MFVSAYVVISFSVSSCLLSEGCLNLICKASSMSRSCLFLAVAMILKESGFIAWCLCRECSRMAEKGGSARRAPVRSLMPWCCAILVAKLHVVCPIYFATEQ